MTAKNLKGVAALVGVLQRVVRVCACVCACVRMCVRVSNIFIDRQKKKPFVFFARLVALFGFWRKETSRSITQEEHADTSVTLRRLPSS